MSVNNNNNKENTKEKITQYIHILLNNSLLNLNNSFK